ncbi:MAG: ParB/RepB/Spo0J family partition protein [Oscillospiraceae bacterium]
MSSVKTIDLDLKKAYDELFMDDKGREENRAPKILDIPISKIDDFPEHPFKVKMDEDMDELVQSVKERGIITPITLRPKEDGRYEIVSGHRRRKACELAGLVTVRAEIQDLTRDEAIILMVESNLQRSNILPSEKAFSYKMKLDAMRRQAGRPAKENSAPVGQNFDNKSSHEYLADNSPDSHSQIQRYIRLTNLTPGLLDMVDDGKIAIRPAVEISYLSKEEQESLTETMSSEEATPSLAQAIKMRDFSKNGKLNEDVILSIISEEKPNQHARFSIPAERIRKYIPDNISPKQTEEYILKALEYYHHYRQKQKELER